MQLDPPFSITAELVYYNTGTNEQHFAFIVNGVVTIDGPTELTAALKTLLEHDNAREDNRDKAYFNFLGGLSNDVLRLRKFQTYMRHLRKAYEYGIDAETGHCVANEIPLDKMQTLPPEFRVAKKKPVIESKATDRVKEFFPTTLDHEDRRLLSIFDINRLGHAAKANVLANRAMIDQDIDGFLEQVDLIFPLHNIQASRDAAGKCTFIINDRPALQRLKEHRQDYISEFGDRAKAAWANETYEDFTRRPYQGADPDIHALMREYERKTQINHLNRRIRDEQEPPAENLPHPREPLPPVDITPFRFNPSFKPLENSPFPVDGILWMSDDNQQKHAADMLVTWQNIPLPPLLGEEIIPGLSNNNNKSPSEPYENQHAILRKREKEPVFPSAAHIREAFKVSWDEVRQAFQRAYKDFQKFA